MIIGLELKETQNGQDYSQTNEIMGVYDCYHLSLNSIGKAYGTMTQGQNRIRENRPSGIAGGLQKTWLKRKVRASGFYPDRLDKCLNCLVPLCFKYITNLLFRQQ